GKTRRRGLGGAHRKHRRDPQSHYDDQACRQYADAQITPLRDQANAQAVGSTILGAGLGAAVAAPASEQPWARSSVPVPPMSKTPRIYAAAIQCVLRSAWRGADIRRRLMRRLQAMSRSQAIRRRARRATPARET